MPRGHKKPTIEKAQEWARNDIDSWQKRDARFHKEQDLLFLKKPYTPKAGEDLVVPSDLAFTTEKATRILAALPERIRIAPRDPSAPERAQKLENLAKSLYKTWAKQHRKGVRLPLRYEEAKFLIQRGWIAARLTLSPDDEQRDPTVFQMFDPANVYPYEVGGEVVRVTHKYRATKTDILDDPNLKAREEDFSALNTSNSGTSASVWIHSQYVKYNGTWYHMVWTDAVGDPGVWLKEPTVIDYLPWVITIAVGTPFRATEWDEDSYIERTGESFITNMVEMHKHTAKTMTMLSTIIATMANPPTALFLKDGGRVTANEITMKAGARMVFPDARLEQYRIGPGLGDLMTYYRM